MKRNDTKYVANLIIQLANENKIELNNMKLNGIIAYIHHDARNKNIDLEIDEPVKGTHFYKIESIYNKFSYHGAEPIRNVPSEFDFLILLKDNHEKIIQQKFTKSKRVSDDTVIKMTEIYGKYGYYLERIMIDLSELDVFELNTKLEDTIKEITYDY